MSSPRDTKKLIWTLWIVGLLMAAFAFVFVNEYSLLNAEMSLIEQKLELAIENQVGNGSVFAYLTSITLWTVLLGLIIGWVWKKILFPSLPFTEWFMAMLAVGTFVMPLSIVFPTFLVSAHKLIWTDWLGKPLAAFYKPTVTNVVTLFGSNHEQGYELVNVGVFLAVGLVILGYLTLVRKGENA